MYFFFQSLKFLTKAIKIERHQKKNSVMSDIHKVVKPMLEIFAAFAARILTYVLVFSEHQIVWGEHRFLYYFSFRNT